MNECIYVYTYINSENKFKCKLSTVELLDKKVRRKCKATYGLS